MESAPKQTNSQSNSAIERALSILELLSNKQEPIGVGDIAIELGLAKSTTHRILETLKVKNFVEQVSTTEKYQIGLKAIEVGMSSLWNWNLVDIAAPYIKQLASDLGETCFLAVYDNGEIVYVYKAEGKQAVSTNAQLGTRKPIHCTGLGKAIVSNFQIEEVDRILTEKGMPKFTEKTIINRQQYLEELSEIRQNGFSMDDEEVEEGLTCYAVPIFNYTGNSIAGISVAGPTDRIKSKKEEVVDLLKRVNSIVSKRLGFVPAMRKSI
jgi:IclR family KDG regulon transcriptional repressor